VSSLIVVCARRAEHRDWAAELRRCSAALEPDNITPHPPFIDVADGAGIAVVNPVPGLARRRGATCLGRMFGDPGAWWRVGEQAPDGTYVIVRHDGESLEVLTDILATRPTWYVHTPEFLLVSTSQRALVMLLGSFELNPEAVTWMLSSGHLGARSWDARLRRLPGDCRLVLDRERWSLTVVERPAVRDPLPVSDAEHIVRLAEAILATCAELELPTEDWPLTLSGGLDSRALLFGLLQAGQRPPCISWGLRSALLDENNDAFIARELADRHSLEHMYWSIDEHPAPAEVAIERFLAASEGQVCDYDAYTDGMAMWKAFFEAGVAGVIRGDEPGMGCTESNSEPGILREHRLVLVDAYPEGHPIHRLGLIEVRPDASLRRRPDESLRSWGARLEEEWFYPAILSRLNSIKESYVEVVNPLMSRRVTEATRRLPDSLYVGRGGLAAAVASLGPEMPVATAGSLGASMPFWDDEKGIAIMRSALRDEEAERVFSRPALDVIVGGLSLPAPVAAAGRGAQRGLKGAVRAVVPRRVIDRLRPVWPLRLSDRQLAFRAYVAVRMAAMLSDDARRLEGPALRK